MKFALFAAAAIMAGSAGLAQDTSGPELDARGIPVVSAPASAPAGANQAVNPVPGAQVVPAPNQSAVFATKQSTDDYPACSRTVTDNCVQAYEVGNPR